MYPAPWSTIRRKIARYPKTTILLILFLITAFPYFVLWRLEKGKYGRWYWNYFASLHPALVHVLPTGGWDPITGPPRWIQEIYDAPWMGTWTVPDLSVPISQRIGDQSAISHRYNNYSSPVILKLHVFSTVQEKARQKRRLIRKLSPVLNIPKEYRHLIEMKFVLGHAYREDWSVDEEMEKLLREEQEEYGDLLRLELVHGENLREGKILDWIHAVGSGEDGGREAWWLFKVDDDAVLNLPVFLNTLLQLDPNIPHYLGTSLNRWPSYHHHFTGMVTGFSWGLVKTLSAGISQMSRQDIEASWDDDVLTGEIMFGLPSAPYCRHTHRSSSTVEHTSSKNDLPWYCAPRQPQPWGWLAPPPSVDPRTGLVRYDLKRRMGDRDVWFIKGDVARHSWWFKFEEHYEKEWRKRIKGTIWKPPNWLREYAETDGR